MRSARPTRLAASREGMEMREGPGNETVRRTTSKAAEKGVPKPVRARRSATAKASAALPLETQSIAVEPKPASTPHAIVVPEPRGRRVEAKTVNTTQGGAGEVAASTIPRNIILASARN